MSEDEFLIPVDQYLKAGLHIGTKFKTKYMEQFIYKVRPDGLFVLNLKKINNRLALLAKFLAQYDPKDIIVVCRRENGWKAVKLLAKYTGIKVFPGRYPPGIITNKELEDFIEPKVLLVTDPWPDRNAINDAYMVGVPIVALCDTNNQVNKIDLVIPCNNKGKKSLALIYWLLAREFLKAKGEIKSDEEFKPKFEDFMDE